MEPADSKHGLRSVDLASFFSGLIAGMIALSNDPWWTLKGANSSQILDVKVSPFYIQINALGVPQITPAAAILGVVTRLLLIGTALVLVFSALQPTAWWKRLGVWFSLSSLVEVYFSLALLIHITQVALVATYGSTAPLLGTANLPANILGLDLAFYQNPPLTATLTLDFFLGLIGLSMLSTGQFYNFLRNRETGLITSDLTKGVKEVHLAPPYQHVWLSTPDKSINPLGRDPEQLTDDELAVSFQKLNNQLQPGGSLSIILPAWAAHLAERLLRLVPWSGFQLEKSELAYGITGKLENELIFRKPVPKQKVPVEIVSDTLTVEVGEKEVEVPPRAEPEARPSWAEPRMTRQELAMVRSATTIIERRKEPVPYKELLNEVYMDLLHRRVDFESAKQIENTLLSHTDRELVLIEELDEAGAKVVKKWWLGDQGVEEERGELQNFWKRTWGRAKPGLSTVRQRVNKWQRRRKQSRYKPKRHTDEE